MRNRRGSALVMILAVTAMAGILIVVVSKIIDTQAKERQITSVRSMRSNIATRTLQALAAPSTMRFSASQSGTGNQSLANCLRLPGATGACPDTPDQWTPFRAIVQHGSTTESSVAAVGGTPAAPVRYTRRGFSNCGTPSPRCPFEVITEFKPNCPNDDCRPAGGGNPAVPADSVDVRVRISLATGINVIPSMPSFQLRARTFPNPDDPTYIEERDRVVVSRSEIFGLDVSQKCPAGSRQIGVYEDGQVRCECFGHLRLPGDPIDPTTRKPICAQAGTQCPIGTALRGFDASGEPICENIEAVCDVVRDVNAAGFADCGPGYRLRSISDPGNCYVRPDNPGGDDDDGVVVCPNISIRCCRILGPND